MLKSKLSKTGICGLTLILALSSELNGAEVNGSPKTNIQEIVVSAMRESVDTMSVPAVVHKISSQEKTADEGVRTTPDSFKGIPSVMVQKTGYGQGSPYLRGFTGFRTLGLIDGVRLNNSVFRDGPNQYWNTIDPYSIDTYELLMGPVAVLYGSDAIGGTVNAIPLAPPEYSGAPVWQNKAIYRWSSAEDSNVGRLQTAAALSDSFGFLAGISMKSFGDLRGGSNVGTQKHTGYDEVDFDLRADYKISRDVHLTAVHQNVDQDDAWRAHKTEFGIPREGLAVGDDKVHSFDQDRQLTYLRLSAEKVASGVDNMEWTVSRHAQEENLYRVKKDNSAERQGFDVETFGAAVQLKSVSLIGDLVYGAEYYRDGVDSYLNKYKTSGAFDKAEIQGPVADDSSYDSVGIYLQDTIKAFDGALDVVPGVRWNYESANAGAGKDPLTGKKTSIDKNWDAVVGSLRLLHPISADRKHTVFTGAAQGFRAPNLSDLTRFDTARTKEVETPAPDLDPEMFLTYEAGYKARTEDASAQLCYYYTTIDKMIIRTPTGRTIDGNSEVTKKNSGNGYVQGVELSLHYEFTTSFSGWISGSLMDGKVDTYPTSSASLERDYVSRLMPPTAEIGARWQTLNNRQWIELVCDGAEKADKLSADDKRDTQRIPPGGTPGYVVASARYGWKITDKIQASVTLENILDQDYRIHGSGVNEPGRNLILTAQHEF